MPTEVVKTTVKSAAGKRRKANRKRIAGSRKVNVRVGGGVSAVPSVIPTRPVTGKKIGKLVSAPSREQHKMLGTFFKRKRGEFTHKLTGKKEESIRLSGRDLISQMNGTTGNYNEAFSQPLNPMSLPGTRLSVESGLWTKFKFHSAKIVFEPAQGSSVVGSLLFTHMEDPDQDPGTPGTFQFAQSLASVNGAFISPCWLPAAHTIKPAQNDKREFYITPDPEQNDRFTIESVLKIVTMQGGQSGTTLGALYFEYDVTLYGPIVNVENLSSFSMATLSNTNNPANSTIGLQDPGAYAPITLYQPTPTTLFTSGTVYSVFVNVDFGFMKAMQIYYIKGAAGGGSSNPMKVYSNPTDAKNDTGENAISGTLLGNSTIPINAGAWYSASGFTPPALKKWPFRSAPLLSRPKEGFTPLPDSDVHSGDNNDLKVTGAPSSSDDHRIESDVDADIFSTFNPTQYALVQKLLRQAAEQKA